MLIDTNVNLGSWPFSPVPDRSGPELAAHLAASGIRCALVSHLGAVFLPEPMPANRRLFAALKHTPGLLPVPVINPALANWREQLAECRAAGTIRAVKILPNFHNYRLRSRRLDDFMAALAETGLKLMLNLRLEDERHKYFALKMKGVPLADIIAFLQRHPTHHILLTGAYWSQEVRPLVASHLDLNFSVEIAFCEAFKTLETMLAAIPANRLMLGTNTPLISTRGQVDKLRCARIPARAKRLIGFENARRFFSL
jgi:predicted TIM-barrel fold metal-dependent hydrolase